MNTVLRLKKWGAFTAAVGDVGPFISQGLLGNSADDGHISILSMGNLNGWRDVKADGDNAECQVCEEVRTARMAYMVPQISCVDMDAECLVGRHWAHVEIIFSENEVHVFALGQFCKATATDSNQHSSWGFSLADLREAQSKDNALCFIIDWLNSSAVPKESAMFSYSPGAKSFWLNKESFVLIDGVLYENEPILGDKNWLFLNP